MGKKDKIFDEKLQRPSDFVFDNRVVEVFDNMVQRSVPFYLEVQRMTIEIAKSFVQQNTNIYDLGCSTGTTLQALCKNLAKEQVQFIGIDNSEEMLKQVKERLETEKCLHRCALEFGDLNKEISMSNASVIIMNWTLQFVRPLNRDKLIHTIYNALVDGGCIICNEKILGNSSLLNRLYIDFYIDFKQRHGYSKLEISQKREALENILIPYRIEENTTLFERNGFSTIDVFFRWYNWVGIIAIK